MVKLKDLVEVPTAFKTTRFSYENYKIVVPGTGKGNTKINSLMNMGTLHARVGGEVCMVLWFRKSDKWGDEISIEYNRFSCDKGFQVESNGGSLGKVFCESYMSISNIPFMIKTLKIFQKIIGKRKNGFIVENAEFKRMVEKEFLKEDKKEDGEQTKLV